MLKKIKLSEGAECVFIKNMRFKTTKISVNFFMPISFDGFSENAMLPFFLSSCTGDYPTPELLSRKLDSLYGAVLTCDAHKQGDKQVMGISISSIDDTYSLDGSKPVEESAELLRKIIFEPSIYENRFLEKDFKREKRLFSELVESEIKNKRAFALSRCIAAMYDGEPYGIPQYGKTDMTDKITNQGLFDAWKDMLKNAYIRIQVVGKAIPDNFIEDFSKSLSSIQKSGNKKEEVLKAESREKVQRVIEKMDILQGKLVLGFKIGGPGSDKEMIPFSVMSDILGGGPYSKLFTIVREKLNLCYYCSSRLNRYKGLLLIDSGVEPENAEMAEKAILEQLEAIKNGDIDESLIEKSIKGVATGVASVEDSSSDTDTWYINRCGEESFCSPKEYIENLKAVTKEEIIAAAQKVQLDTVYSLMPKGEQKDE